MINWKLPLFHTPVYESACAQTLLQFPLVGALCVRRALVIINWVIVLLHLLLCGVGLLIATLSSYIACSYFLQENQIKRLENMSLLSFVMVEFWIIHQQFRWLFHFIFKNVKVNNTCHWNKRNEQWPCVHSVKGCGTNKAYKIK